MRRVLAFLHWKAVWWTEKRGRDLNVRPDIADGIRAYAAKQAHVHRALARSFSSRWESADRDREHGHEQDESDFFDDCGELDEDGGAKFDTDAD
jgi:hypothetical protein